MTLIPSASSVSVLDSPNASSLLLLASIVFTCIKNVPRLHLTTCLYALCLGTFVDVPDSRNFKPRTCRIPRVCSFNHIYFVKFSFQEELSYESQRTFLKTSRNGFESDTILRTLPKGMYPRECTDWWSQLWTLRTNINK